MVKVGPKPEAVKEELDSNMPTDPENNGAYKPASIRFALEPLNLKSPNLPVAFKNWLNQFKIFMRAADLESQDDSRKVALLLHHMGPESIHIFNSFNEDIDKIKYDALVKKLQEYFVPKANVAMERHKFFTRHQEPNESIEEYVTVLKNLSLNCSFDTLRENLVRDIFICGLKDNLRFIKEKLLNEGDINLDKVICIAKTMELTRAQTQQLEERKVDGNSLVGVLQTTRNLSQTSKPVYRRSESSNYRRKQNNCGKTRSVKPSNNFSDFSPKCTRCGQVHRYRCPAIGVICNKCKQKNHFASMCKTKKIGILETSDIQSSSADLFIGVLSAEERDAWYINFFIKNKEIRAQLDTGTHTNVMSIETFQKLNLDPKKIIESNANIFTFSRERLNIIGQCDIICEVNNQYQKINFNIVDFKCQTVFGLPTCVKLNLVRKICAISEDKNYLLQKYDDVFKGLGCLKNECTLKLKPDVQPVVECSRRIPFKLHGPLKEELDRLVQLKVIEPIEEPTDWVNSIVIVNKPEGKLRLCLDPRPLNRAILRSHFIFPTLEDVKTKLYNAKYFSILDANSGFWTIPLEENSSKLCTFITPFGRFRFLRLPFGINAAPEIFHAEMVKSFKDIPGLTIYIDDFLISGSTKEEHDERLEMVLKRAKEIGLKFNKSKSKICQKEVRYIGHIFSASGVKPDYSKVEAICKLPSPTNATELQRFLGMVNYLGAYIQNLADQTVCLRKLLKKDLEWSWGPEHEKEFNK